MWLQSQSDVKIQRKFDRNFFDENKPLYIIGDVHGCLKTLEALVEQIPEKWNAQLVFVGDLVDKGDYSCEVIEKVKNGGYACVIGNHELLMLEYFYKIPNVWLQNGGYETLESYKRAPKGLMSEHIQWIETLPKYIKIHIKDESGKKLFITHGFGLPFYKERKKQEREKDFMWNRLRNSNWEEIGNADNSKVFNIFGHDVQKSGEILKTKNFAAIDTGCVYDILYSPKLTAMEWPSKRIFQQKNIENR